MKEIKSVCWLNVDGKTILVVGKEYKGGHLIMFAYDVLITSKTILAKYKKDLIADHLIKRGWKPVIKII